MTTTSITAVKQWIREILDKTEIGHLTEPEVTTNGVEVFALCSKKQTKIESVAKREVTNELYAKQFETNAKKLMRTLRKAAMIEVKEIPDAKAVGANTR